MLNLSGVCLELGLSPTSVCANIMRTKTCVEERERYR